jgi:hypothetical protein
MGNRSRLRRTMIVAPVIVTPLIVSPPATGLP